MISLLSLSDLAFERHGAILMDAREKIGPEADPNDLRVFLKLETQLLLLLLSQNAGPKRQLTAALTDLVKGVDFRSLSAPQKELLVQRAAADLQAYKSQIVPLQRTLLHTRMTDIGQRTQQAVIRELNQRQAAPPSASASASAALAKPPDPPRGGAPGAPPRTAPPPPPASYETPKPAKPPDPKPPKPAEPKPAASQTTSWNQKTASWGPKDQLAVDYLSRNQALYAGKYIDENMVKRARNIITRDYSLYGDDPEAIGKRVKDSLVSMANVTDSYWQTVATNALAQARTYANLATLHAAGVTHYVFVSVLDERTTTLCRHLNGATWSVAPSLDRMERAISARELSELEAQLPFVRDVVGEDGETIGFAIGTTQLGLEPDLNQLAALGANIPPLHFYCRSTIKAA